MAADPVAAAADLLEIRSSGMEGAARSQEEVVLNQEAVESPSAIHPSVENPAAAAVGECSPSEEVRRAAGAECCPSEAVLLKAAVGSPSSRARP